MSPTPRPPVDVLFVQRRPTGAQISIERLFEQLRARLDADVRPDVFVCPFPSRGLLPRLRNLRAVRRAARGRICHVTGDVHYLALGLPAGQVVLTIHDCAVLHRLRGWRRALVRRLWFVWPVRHAAAVTAISEATRADLARWLPPALHEKIRVVPNCVRDEFVPAPRAFAADCPVFLQVGTGWNKNLDAVAEALRGLRCRLLIVGPLAPAQRDVLEANGIDYTALGRVDDAALVAAYQACDALLFVSRFEGFGLPILEAQATGRPVIASDTDVSREAAGAGALFADPLSPASIRACVTRLCAAPDLRAALVQQGFENVARFQAAHVAARYAAVYRDVAARREG